MRVEDLNRAVAEASPIRDADVAGFDFERAEAELIQEIMASPGDADLAIPGEPRARRRFTGGRAVAAAVAGVAVAAAVTFVGIGSLGGDDRPAFAAEAIKVAEANPRLLVTEPGWTVTRADEFTTDNGEMIFSNGSDQLELFWRPADDYKGYLDDRADGTSESQIELLGRTATMFRTDDTFSGAPNFTTLLPPEGQSFLEIRGDELGTQQAYLALIDTLQPTDVDSWLAAMPASIVKPGDRAATVDEMLRGIPLPPGFDVSALEHGATISDRYQLGAQVTGAVACEWLDRWTAAVAAGDTAKVEQAKQAMATSRTWPMLLEMNKQGGYPDEVWDWRDRLGDSGLGRNTTRNYSPGLGCGTR